MLRGQLQSPYYNTFLRENQQLLLRKGRDSSTCTITSVIFVQFQHSVAVAPRMRRGFSGNTRSIRRKSVPGERPAGSEGRQNGADQRSFYRAFRHGGGGSPPVSRSRARVPRGILAQRGPGEGGELPEPVLRSPLARGSGGPSAFRPCAEIPSGLVPAEDEDPPGRAGPRLRDRKRGRRGRCAGSENRFPDPRHGQNHAGRRPALRLRLPPVSSARACMASFAA